jgi:hypothetical protein
MLQTEHHDNTIEDSEDQMLIEVWTVSQALVAQACNPRYLGGG